MKSKHKNFSSYSGVTNRVLSLGSEKWLPHLKARQMQETTPNLITLTIGEPDIPVSTKLIEICYKSMKSGRTRYSNGRGEEDLLKTLSKKYSTSSGREITPHNILCFPGTQTALFVALHGLAEEGDEVLVGDPLYASYEGVIEATGATLVKVPLNIKHGFSMQIEDLKKAITPKSKVLLLNSPHNPTGAILSEKEILAIGDLCLQEGIWMISDEVYSDLIFENSSEKFFSPLNWKKFRDNTVVVSSISKSHAAPGFRSGWMVGPEDFCKQLLPLSETILFGNQPFIADMTTFALEHEKETAATMRRDYERRARLVANAFSNCFGLDVFYPKAGMFIMVDISKTGKNSDEFTNLLLQREHVATMPGSSFGEQAKDFIRMSLTVPDKDLRDACSRMIRFVSNCNGG